MNLCHAHQHNINIAESAVVFSCKCVEQLSLNQQHFEKICEPYVWAEYGIKLY